MSGRRQRTLLLVIVAFVLGGTGCGLADFTYDLAPRIALRYADDYLQLTNSQEEQALDLFRERMALHAEDELPRYYAFIARVQEKARDGVDRKELDPLLERAEKLVQLGVRRTIPAVGAILVDLDADQLDALEERLREDLAEARERGEDAAERRQEEALDDAQEWLGELEDAQQQLIVDSLDGFVDTRSLWLDWREERNKRLLAYLRGKPDVADVEKFLENAWLERAGMSEALRDGVETNRDRYIDMLVALDGTLMPEQRMHALDKLSGYRETILDLLPEGTSVAASDAPGEREDLQ